MLKANPHKEVCFILFMSTLLIMSFNCYELDRSYSLPIFPSVEPWVAVTSSQFLIIVQTLLLALFDVQEFHVLHLWQILGLIRSIIYQHVSMYSVIIFCILELIRFFYQQMLLTFWKTLFLFIYLRVSVLSELFVHLCMTKIAILSQA